MEGWRYTPTSADSFQVAPLAYALKPIVPGEKISYRWYEGTTQIGSDQTINVAPVVTTTYHAFCTLCDGQEFTDSLTVVVIPYIPNAFTPNHDGKNDEFRVIGLPPESITRFNMEIYNRWGQSVFHSSDVTVGWDGTLNGQPCPPDEYVWVLYYEDGNKRHASNKGTILLLR
jgi:gliding motility-associated-like protein